MPDATYAELYVACRMLQMARSSHTSHSYQPMPQGARRKCRLDGHCAPVPGAPLGMAAARSARRPRYAAREQRATKRRATRVVRRAAMPAPLVAACASRRNLNRQRVDDGRTGGPPRVVLQCSAPSRHGFPLSGITRGSRLTRRVLTRAQVTGFAVAITFGCLYLIRRALERV